MPETMKAMLLKELGPVESKPLKLTEIPKHEISTPTEVLIKIEACGVCHSQLHGIEGDWKDIGIAKGKIVKGEKVLVKTARQWICKHLDETVSNADFFTSKVFTQEVLEKINEKIQLLFNYGDVEDHETTEDFLSQTKEVDEEEANV